MKSAAFSPDGKGALVVSSRHSRHHWWHSRQHLMMWNIGGGSVHFLFKYKFHHLAFAALSPDGQLVLMGFTKGDAWSSRVVVRDLRDLHGPKRQSFHIDYAYSGVFSPDGQRVLFACRKGEAELWDLRTGKFQRRFYAHFFWRPAVHTAVFSPDGAHVLTTSKDSAWLFDAKTGKHQGKIGSGRVVV